MQCARALGLTSRTVGYPVRVLEQRQWVTKRRAPQDDRYVLITLTQKGKALAEKMTRQLTRRAVRANEDGIEGNAAV